MVTISDSLDTYRMRGEMIFRSYKKFVKTIVTCISVTREQLGKHVPVKKNSWPTIGKEISIARQRTGKLFLTGCVRTMADVYF
jgi:hypothetical protein